MSLRGSSLLGVGLVAINVGLPLFAESLREQGIRVVDVDWRPPAGGDQELMRMLDRLNQDDVGDLIDGK